MPLILDPERYSVEALEELVRSLRSDLEETGDLVRHPRGRVLDPVSLETAELLLAAALQELSTEGGRTVVALAARANLAYATLLAVVDLVKSHTDVPRVPRARSSPPP